jgi:hypothetical protein
VPYDTCLTYEACSQESKEGGCANRPADAFTCTPINTCRTCSTFTRNGGFCSEVDVFPNASVAEYGRVRGEARIMAEVFARGPVACEVDAAPLDKCMSLFPASRTRAPISPPRRPRRSGADLSARCVSVSLESSNASVADPASK